MPLLQRNYRIRSLLGIICIIAAIAFMVHSFLEPKPSPILKLSNYADARAFGQATYRQLQAKVSEKSVFVFTISDFEAEKDYILGFLQSGQEVDQREYILVTDESAWTDTLSQNFSFKGIVPTEESLDSDSFVSPTYIVLVRKEEPLKKPSDLYLGAASRVEYVVYTFTSVAFSTAEESKVKCSDHKSAMQQEPLSDLSCFRMWIEKKLKHTKSLSRKEYLGALDQVQLRRYVWYYAK